MVLVSFKSLHLSSQPLSVKSVGRISGIAFLSIFNHRESQIIDDGCRCFIVCNGCHVRRFYLFHFIYSAWAQTPRPPYRAIQWVLVVSDPSDSFEFDLAFANCKQSRKKHYLELGPILLTKSSV